jgi:putative transposase
VNRSRFYYKKAAPPAEDVDLMNEMRDIYNQYPFFGYRKLHAMLLRNGHKHNLKKTERLARLAGLRAIYPKQKTASRNKDHAIYPYLLKDMDIVHVNQVWQVDITYIRIRGGFVYLVCLIDVFSRKVMGFALSTFLDTESCLVAFENALLHAKPEIINSDQGCQFTSSQWINRLKEYVIKISMDGKGRWADNVFIERLWRSLKYELVYLHRFETVEEARSAIARYIVFYNTQRPHQALNYKTPDQIFYGVNYEQSIELGQDWANLFLGFQRGSQIFRHILS